MSKAKRVKATSFTKVVGYISPTSNFNVGRKAEEEVRVKAST
jgi:anaerobic ribonucleoside-triphosphate reductase